MSYKEGNDYDDTENKETEEDHQSSQIKNKVNQEQYHENTEPKKNEKDSQDHTEVERVSHKEEDHNYDTKDKYTEDNK